MRIVGRSLLALVVLVAAVYGGEDLVLRYRMAHNPASPVIDQVPVYDAAEVKGGKVEFYFNQGETQPCVHALFPHFGDAPCWYVKGHPQKQV